MASNTAGSRQYFTLASFFVCSIDGTSTMFGQGVVLLPSNLVDPS
jgi:hypothetical protein